MRFSNLSGRFINLSGQFINPSGLITKSHHDVRSEAPYFALQHYAFYLAYDDNPLSDDNSLCHSSSFSLVYLMFLFLLLIGDFNFLLLFGAPGPRALSILTDKVPEQVRSID